MVTEALCQHDGGMGVGAGHICYCARTKGHPIDGDRPHQCHCGAQWRDRCDPAIGHHSTPHRGWWPPDASETYDCVLR